VISLGESENEIIPDCKVLRGMEEAGIIKGTAENTEKKNGRI